MLTRWENFYREPTNTILTRNLPELQPLSSAFYPLCKSIESKKFPSKF